MPAPQVVTVSVSCEGNLQIKGTKKE